MTYEIYLDMDGVCVDFMGATIDAHGFDSGTMLNKWQQEHPGSLFPESLFGMPAETFFTHERLGEAEFWRDLAAYPWFESMFDALSRQGHVVFLTAPTDQPGCVAGKHQWLKDTFGSGFTDFIFTRHKDRLAHGNAILVDDLYRNIESFSHRDGHGVLFPQTWNDHHAHLEDASGFVVQQIEHITGGHR
jgi:5'(3')-deoxyribonucleotidase